MTYDAFWTVVHDFQPLIAGLSALIAAAITAFYLRRGQEIQAQQFTKEFEHRRDQELRASYEKNYNEISRLASDLRKINIVIGGVIEADVRSSASYKIPHLSLQMNETTWGAISVLFGARAMTEMVKMQSSVEMYNELRTRENYVDMLFSDKFDNILNLLYRNSKGLAEFYTDIKSPYSTE